MIFGPNFVNELRTRSSIGCVTHYQSNQESLLNCTWATGAPSEDTFLVIKAYKKLHSLKFDMNLQR